LLEGRVSRQIQKLNFTYSPLEPASAPWQTPRMISSHGIYQHGAVVLDEPVSLPEGAHVRVTLDPIAAGSQPEQPDSCIDGSLWDDSLEGKRAWLEWFDSLEPIMTEAEYQQWESQRLAEKEQQKQLAAQESGRLEKMFP
jgi:hypothetical protein